MEEFGKKTCQVEDHIGTSQRTTVLNCGSVTVDLKSNKYNKYFHGKNNNKPEDH